jgi:hypothetical protein
MGGGYAPLAYRAETGIDLESTHVIVRALAAYDDGHKTNDGDQPNPKGHDRYLESTAYFRIRSVWFFGGGWRWRANFPPPTTQRVGPALNLAVGTIGSCVLATGADPICRCVLMLIGLRRALTGKTAATGPVPP